jgi:hypothetical protein
VANSRYELVNGRLPQSPRHRPRQLVNQRGPGVGHRPTRISTPAISASAAIRTPGKGNATNPVSPVRMSHTDKSSIPALRVTISAISALLRKSGNHTAESDESRLRGTQVHRWSHQPSCSRTRAAAASVLMAASLGVMPKPSSKREGTPRHGHQKCEADRNPVRPLSRAGECPDRRMDAGRPDREKLVDMSALRCGERDSWSQAESLGPRSERCGQLRRDGHCNLGPPSVIHFGPSN